MLSQHRRRWPSIGSTSHAGITKMVFQFCAPELVFNVMNTWYKTYNWHRSTMLVRWTFLLTLSSSLSWGNIDVPCYHISSANHMVSLDMKGCICHFTKWQIQCTPFQIQGDEFFSLCCHPPYIIYCVKIVLCHVILLHCHLYAEWP